MKEDVWEIAICGTFDVQNYGDLLFPIVAEAELTKRLGAVKLHRFSYHAKSTPEWPYTVTSVTQLPDLARHLDGILIGGGFIVRFDKDVAPAYGPPTSEIHHPTGYWLTPALIALQHGIPLVWNAPGMHCNMVPEWVEPLMRLVLQNSCHIRVRDEPSREALKHFCMDSEIAVLPDTAFGISRIINSQSSAELKILRELSGLTGPYIIVQAIHCIAPFIRFVQKHPQIFEGLRVLLLPVGPVLGDHEAVIESGFPNAVRLPSWPSPLLLAELISQAEAVVGHSYHVAITALACGVPVFSSADLSEGKYTALSEFETIFPLPRENEDKAWWFLSRIGKSIPPVAAQRALAQLDEHWDRIANVIREGKVDTQPMLGRFLQDLPNLLEAGTVEPVADQRQVDQLKRDLVLANSRIRALYSSRSFRITAPLRYIVRRLSTYKTKEIG
jgi:lipopolysaccharide transport system ATP-binding protein